ncbi:hypothetical protein [Nitratidesulfovibrio liaohensis]|uniref:Lipoprotein n=1 Tax=Nitratidesulfovibrio liaohensis TaxID=2604158 RepID=A0ABY9R1Z8_9BACT|nr:hypothetical protein [Nitratidesulfovibrio liaohensis]WMW65780.1 hypothetical protein KPS_000291 [Nitratidesulfovibrio liaohensis]
MLRIVALLLMLLLTACSSGPSNIQVEQAFKEKLVSSDFTGGMISKNIQIKNFIVDDIARGDSGTYVATITVTSSTNMMGMESTSTAQNKIKLKLIDNKWVVLD